MNLIINSQILPYISNKKPLRVRKGLLNSRVATSSVREKRPALYLGLNFIAKEYSLSDSVSSAWSIILLGQRNTFDPLNI